MLIAALTIGQSPRPDLVDPLRQYLPDQCQVIEGGALDGLDAGDIPPINESIYPLTTRMSDGSLVMVEESFLLPRLQDALAHLERKGAAATILLCAGTFDGLEGKRPFFKPFSIAREKFEEAGLKSLGLIAPIKEQENPIRQRWLSAGFQPAVWTADIREQNNQFKDKFAAQIAAHNLECIVLDYVGHPADTVSLLQENSPLPVFDLGQLAMEALVQFVA